MTNKTISLTIPNDDPIALHEFGAAMQRMAGRHGLEVPQAAPSYEAVAQGAQRTAQTMMRTMELMSEVEAMTHDTDKAQLAALGEAVEIVKAAAPALMDDKFKYDGEEVSGPRAETTPSHLDSDGLPWDARIHATGKDEHGYVTHPRNADDTWRARRKPSDMDAGQWAEFQGQVRTELRALMELPVEQEVATVLEYSAEQAGRKCSEAVVEQPTPIVVEPVEPEPIVVTPPPVVAPPVPDPVAPPAPTGAGPTEFVPFLQWITSSGITPEQVNVALAQHGLTAVPQLQQRPDLIPQVHATLAAGV